MGDFSGFGGAENERQGGGGREGDEGDEGGRRQKGSFALLSE